MIKVFVQSVYPAPYRAGVFDMIDDCKDIDLTVAFENDCGDNRNSEWFQKKLKNNTIIIKKQKDEYKRTIKKLKEYDIVIAYDYSSISSIKLLLKCKLLKIPYIINCDGAIISKNKNFKDIIKTFFIKGAVACFANGQSANKYFLIHGAKKENIYEHKFSALYEQDILENPVSPQRKQQLKTKNGIDKNKKVFLCIGSYINLKGYDLILEVDKKLKNNDIEFINIGGGEKHTEYEKIAEEYKLNNIVFKEFMKKKELLEFYDMADVFLFPTRGDVWGLVVNEAMARGLPVITTDACNAGLELVENGINGELIESNSVNQLEIAIKKYANKTDKQLYEYGKNSIIKIKGYTIENISNSHIEVLKKICKEK